MTTLRKKMVAFGIGSLLVLILATWALEAFLDQIPGKHWTEAIQTMTTAVLIVVTAMYAYWTRVGLTLHEEDIRRRGEEPAARDCLKALVQADRALFHLQRYFPVTNPERPDPGPLTAEWLQNLDDTIQDTAYQLSEPLRRGCLEFARTADEAERHLHLLRDAIAHEDDEAAQEGREWNLDRARTYFEGFLRPALPERQRPEWEHLIAGTAMRDFQARRLALIEALERYLHS